MIIIKASIMIDLSAGSQPYIMIAETKLGRGNEAWEYYSKICPSYLEDVQSLHKVEPYVYCQMIAGKDAYKPGEGKNSWLSGTAAWNFYAVVQYILGINPDYDGLEINPCIPNEWPGYKVKRKFRGANLHIDIQNPNKVSKGVKSVTINGKRIDGSKIPILPPGDHQIKVVLG